MKSAARVQESVVAAAAWRLLALLFERPRPGWSDQIRALAAEVDDSTLRAAAAAAVASGESEYLDVLGPGGAVSPREVAYRGRLDPARILADIAAFYAAFAYRPRAEDPPDHVAVEAGFAGYLELKAAYALARGDGEAERACREALARFVSEHLRCIAAPLLAKLQLLSPVPHLAGAAAALLARTGPAPAGYAEPFPGDVDSDAFSCDGCGGSNASTGEAD
jgi:hypothetical protein